MQVLSADEASGLLRFSSEVLPAEHRVEEWQDVLGSVFTGCRSSSMAHDSFAVDLDLALGSAAAVGKTHCAAVRNQRTNQCLSDGGEDYFLYLVSDGTGWFQQGEERHVLRPGHVVMGTFTRPFDSGWVKANGLGIVLSRSLFGGADMDRRIGRLADPAGTRLLMSYATAVFEEARLGMPIAPMHERHLAELVGSLAFGLDQGADSGATSAARVSRMREVIARCYAHPNLSMCRVARTVNLSERAGYLAFERAKLSFTDELQRVRLDRARERLCLGAASVIEIAYEVGFSDASHFYRLFKRRFGCTPGEFRRLASGTQPSC
jgi:AraC-like DNA-binding protein